jgi:hypothetical protein
LPACPATASVENDRKEAWSSCSCQGNPGDARLPWPAGASAQDGRSPTTADLLKPLLAQHDLEGKDRSLAKEDFAQGAGLLGIGLLVDLYGDDVYEAGRLAQAAGSAGIGLLIDHGGKDRYSGDAFVQGAGDVGIGLPLDLSGNDAMDAKG